ncbi:MAG: phasin family protein [Rhodocyclaceae bacterium]|nr:phasin family protein [Rhodocyclaceae bacterium]
MATKQQEQFSAIQKKNLETAMRLAQMSIENSQRIMEVQVQTAKELFEDSMANAKALTGTRDPKDMLSLRTEYAQNTTEKMLACARQIAEITGSAQAEVGRMVSEQLATGSTDAMEAMQKMFAGMQFGDQNAMNVFQGAMTQAQSAFEQMTRASSEAFQAFTQAGGAAAKRGRK